MIGAAERLQHKLPHTLLLNELDLTSKNQSSGTKVISPSCSSEFTRVEKLPVLTDCVSWSRDAFIME